MLDIATDLIRPYDHDVIELPVLGLLHGHRGEEMRCAIAMLSSQRHVSSNDRLDLQTGKFRPSESMEFIFDPGDCPRTGPDGGRERSAAQVAAAVTFAASWSPPTMVCISSSSLPSQ